MDSNDDALSPQFEVWNHVESGIQMARDDLRESVGDENAELYEALADQILQLNVGILLSTGESSIPPLLADSLPGVTLEEWRDAIRRLPRDPSKWKPALRHAVEIRIAERSVARMYDALDRYGAIQPLLVSPSIPERLLPYLRELTDAYLLGFDAACIALAGASFEQVAKSALIATGKVTEARLRREKPTAEGLRSLLREHGLVSTSGSAAERLVTRRNTVLHQNIFDQKVLPALSLDSVREFVEVCEELSPSWPPAT